MPRKRDVAGWQSGLGTVLLVPGAFVVLVGGAVLLAQFARDAHGIDVPGPDVFVLPALSITVVGVVMAAIGGFFVLRR